MGSFIYKRKGAVKKLFRAVVDKKVKTTVVLDARKRRTETGSGERFSSKKKPYKGGAGTARGKNLGEVKRGGC